MIDVVTGMIDMRILGGSRQTLPRMGPNSGRTHARQRGAQGLHPFPRHRLQTIGKAGNALLTQHPKDWKKRLAALGKIDWSRGNAKVWEGRALISGKVSKVTTNVILTTNVIKKALKLTLEASELKVENAHIKKNTP